jgi:hypothetical protein
VALLCVEEPVPHFSFQCRVHLTPSVCRGFGEGSGRYG